MIDLSSFSNAISQLEKGLAECSLNPENELLRDGVIKRFEYTYELSHKFLRRYLLQSDPSPETVNEMSFANLIRTASDKGLLLHDWDVWEGYRKARGTTSHIYNGSKACEVFRIIPAFLEEARYLHDRLAERQDA